MDKKILRSNTTAQLNSLSSTVLQEISQGLTEQLTHFFQLNPGLISQIGGAYLPMKNEVAADFNYLASHFSLKISYPILKDKLMSFGLSPNPQGKLWLLGPYQEVVPSWLLIPGLNFSLKGDRLGRGGGYYDRYLGSNIPLRIALTYSALICDNIPVGPHDVPMDFIITESFCWDVVQQKRI